jgi:hypothetical protein
MIKFFQQKKVAWPWKALSPIVSNIFMHHFDSLALDSAQHKPLVWLWYFEHTFVVQPHGQE